MSLVWEVAFESEEPYERGRVRVEESGDERRWATWHTPTALREASEPCYPVGVFDLLGDATRITSS